MRVIHFVSQDPSALRPGGEGWEAALSVRMLHSRVRLRLLGKASARANSTSGNSSSSSGGGGGGIRSHWDVTSYGLPINQEDMVGTLLAFSVNVLEAIHRIGARITEQVCFPCINFTIIAIAFSFLPSFLSLFLLPSSDWYAHLLLFCAFFSSRRKRTICTCGDTLATCWVCALSTTLVRLWPERGALSSPSSSTSWSRTSAPGQ